MTVTEANHLRILLIGNKITMEAPKYIQEILARLYSNRYLSVDEIRNLDQWLNQFHSDPLIDDWLKANWEKSENVEHDISFEEIRRRIAKYEHERKSVRFNEWYGLLQKVAAILLFPLLALSIWLITDRQPQASPMALATAKGEHTHVYLPDGTEVWLNVDSKLEYSTAFNAVDRNLKLEGEAFFKVAKDKKHPFIVSANDLRVKVVGTEFNISAYKTEPNTTTYLKEGIVELKYAPSGKKEQTYHMLPGEKATIVRNEKSISIRDVVSANDTRWTNGELYFDNEPMDQVFRKVERWYNVKISYQIADFSNETLSVNLKNNESIYRLMEIINEAIGINVKQNGNEYVITRSKRK